MQCFDENTRYKVIMEEDEWIIHVEKSVFKIAEQRSKKAVIIFQWGYAFAAQSGNVLFF